MVFRRAVKVLAADAVLLVALFYVIQDLQWRSGYAASVHDACAGYCSYTPSFSYGFLTQLFTMSGNSLQLTSPVTFDWVQALIYILVAVNAWFAYGVLRARNEGADVGVPPKEPS